MSPELRAAIEGVYQAFNDVPRPRKIDTSPFCLTFGEATHLIETPRRDLTPGDLGHYAFSAFNTVGSVPDFLYLLPRILEILAADSSWWPDVEVVLPKLNEARITKWPERRRTAVLQYVDAAFDDVLTRGNCGSEVDSWICALGRLFGDVASRLERLARHPQVVMAYYEHNSASLIKGRLSNAFWDADSTSYKQVIDWFSSPDIKKVIYENYGL